MKQKFILPLAAALFLCAYSVSAQSKTEQSKEQKAKYKTENVKMKMKGDFAPVSLPYTVDYSSQFIPGNPKYSKTVLDLWKEFDLNVFNLFPDALADTVSMETASGTVMHGKQQVMDGLKSYRSSLSSFVSTVDAVMSMHSIDKDEDWVLVWGSGTETTNNGQSKTVLLHEAWRLNKIGQVDLIMQYTRQMSKM